MTKQYVGNYALALFSVCKENSISIEEVYNELLAINGIFNDNAEFQLLLSSPTVTEEEKLDMLNEAFGGKMSDIVYDFMCVLTEKRMISVFSDICASFKSLYYDDINVVEAVVTTTVALSDVQKDKLKNKLKKQTGKDVILIEKIDDQLIGGIVVNYSDTLIDASLKTRLAEMKNSVDSVIA